MRATVKLTRAQLSHLCGKSSKMILETDNTHSIGMLDSGSNMNLSGEKSDFAFIAEKPDIAITAVDGDVAKGGLCAHSAKFKPNSLGLTHGTYFPSFKGGQRILSGYELTKVGWEIILNQTGSSRVQADKVCIPVNWLKDRLPYVNIGFQGTNNPHAIQYPVKVTNIHGGLQNKPLTFVGHVQLTCNKARKIPNFNKMSNSQRLDYHKSIGHLSLFQA